MGLGVKVLFWGFVVWLYCVQQASAQNTVSDLHSNWSHSHPSSMSASVPINAPAFQNWDQKGFHQLVQTAIQSIQTSNSDLARVERATRTLGAGEKVSGANLYATKYNEYKPHSAAQDEFSTTLKFTQTYNGIEVIGKKNLFHFDRFGNLKNQKTEPQLSAINTVPTLSEEQALKIVVDRYQIPVEFSAKPELKIFQDFNNKTRLVFILKTKTTEGLAGRQSDTIQRNHLGKIIYLDAHTGEIILEMNRVRHTLPVNAPTEDSVTGAFTSGTRIENLALLKTTKATKNIVYRADTNLALKHVVLEGPDAGFPTDLNLEWYAKTIENESKNLDLVDRSSLNAYNHANRVYSYYFNNFGRQSYDNKDSAMVSIVHMGYKMDNAFWSDEHQVIAFGDGDGEYTNDFSYALDIAAHEWTHALIDSEAQLISAGEPGALNESYADFFSKMVDYRKGNWYCGRRIISKELREKKGILGIRNMLHPEEFDQPDTYDSPLRVPTTNNCNEENDSCGIHQNMGIPNRVGALITEAIGKQKAQKLYYNVLTQRLTETSNFKDARLATEEACIELFSASSDECAEVRKAFDIVKI